MKLHTNRPARAISVSTDWHLQFATLITRLLLTVDQVYLLSFDLKHAATELVQGKGDSKFNAKILKKCNKICKQSLSALTRVSMQYRNDFIGHADFTSEFTENAESSIEALRDDLINELRISITESIGGDYVELMSLISMILYLLESCCQITEYVFKQTMLPGPFKREVNVNMPFELKRSVEELYGMLFNKYDDVVQNTDRSVIKTKAEAYYTKLISTESINEFSKTLEEVLPKSTTHKLKTCGLAKAQVD